MEPEFYLPLAKHPPQTAFVMARTEGDPIRFANTIREQVLAVDRDQPAADVKTMEAVFEGTLGQRRLTMLLLGSFAGVALLLAVVGIYGVMSYGVSQRTGEIGFRMALGAQRGDVMRLILWQALKVTGIGVRCGPRCLHATALIDGDIDDHRARLHRFHGFARDQFRRHGPRHQDGRDDQIGATAKDFDHVPGRKHRTHAAVELRRKAPQGFWIAIEHDHLGAHARGD